MKLFGEFSKIMNFNQTLDLNNPKYEIKGRYDIPDCLCDKRQDAPDSLNFYKNDYLRLEELERGAQAQIFICYNVVDKIFAVIKRFFDYSNYEREKKMY